MDDAPPDAEIRFGSAGRLRALFCVFRCDSEHRDRRRGGGCGGGALASNGYFKLQCTRRRGDAQLGLGLDCCPGGGGRRRRRFAAVTYSLASFGDPGPAPATAPVRRLGCRWQLWLTQPPRDRDERE